MITINASQLRRAACRLIRISHFPDRKDQLCDSIAEKEQAIRRIEQKLERLKRLLAEDRAELTAIEEMENEGAGD